MSEPDHTLPMTGDELKRLIVRIGVAFLVVAAAVVILDWLTSLRESISFRRLAVIRFKSDATERDLCLPWCEFLVALTARKDRIDEAIGDHREELATVVRLCGMRRGVWIVRLRLIVSTFHRLPAMTVRVIKLIYSVG
jgi:hypothetical protein